MKKFEVWVADLNPRVGTEAGKVRPVVVVQTNLLNPVHPSTLVCPISTNVSAGATLLRVHLSAGEAGLAQDSDVLVDQIRAIDNQRFQKQLGVLPVSKQAQLNSNLKAVLDL